MTSTPLRAIGVLSLDACADAMRRRIVPAIVVLSLLSLLAVESCTSCAPSITLQGQAVEAERLAGWSGALIFLVLGLWTLVLAGVLAAGHLAECLEDGTAALILARPVSRRAYVLSRLLGALAIGLAAGGVLLGGAALLVHGRLGLALAPVAGVALACAAGAVVVAALAMLASLFVPQLAAVLLVLLVIGATAAANALTQFGAAAGGLIGALDVYGPPLYTAMALALTPWFDAAPAPGAVLAVGVRLVLWIAVSLLALVLTFQSEEVR